MAVWSFAHVSPERVVDGGHSVAQAVFPPFAWLAVCAVSDSK